MNSKLEDNIVLDIESYKKGDFIKDITINKSKVFYDTKNDSATNIPGVYIIKNSENKFYIGESMDPIYRLKQHRDKKFTKDSQALIFQSNEFNKSVIYDVETKLIKYLSTEKPGDILNDKFNQKDHKYFMKSDYKQVTEEIWDHLLKENWANNLLSELENRALFKYSPFTSLTKEQNDALKQIETQIKKEHTNILLNGEAGTGKTILLVKLFIKLIKDEDNQFNNIGFVIPNTELLKIVKRITKLFKNKEKNIVLGKPSKISKSDHMFDIILVDEAHRLNDKNNYVMHNQIKHLKESIFDNDVQMIKSLTKRTVFAYDKSQALRPGDVLDKEFMESLMPDSKIRIETQMRILGGKDYCEWVAALSSGKLNKYIKTTNYDFKIFDSFSKMYKEIKQKSENNDLVFITSGNTRDRVENDYDFKIDGINLNWNAEPKDLKKKAWIETKGAIDLREVGYFNYIQGIDMNYNAVIIGRDLTLNDKNELDINIEFIKNQYDRPRKTNNLNYLEEHKTFILNRYKILLTRAIKGTYIWFEDEKLREYFKRLKII